MSVNILLFIIDISLSSTTPPFPCPTPEDRVSAWYTGGPCSGSYSCCFSESIISSYIHTITDM